MADFFLGVLAVLAGLVFCFSGYFWLRIALPVWGALVGFVIGSDQVHDDWWWYLVVVALALVGTISQMRDATAMRRRLPAGWASSPE